MHEGRNIHYSQVDSKLLCSYSLKVCRQRRLNGYAFCNRHILEDPTAPFKRCVHISSRGKARCSNPIPQDRNTDMCNIHQQKVNAAATREKKELVTKKQPSQQPPQPPPPPPSTTNNNTTSTTPPTMSPNNYPIHNNNNPNGLLSSHHHNTPPTTPTQDPQRLFIMDRLKNKFTRVQSCPSEDVLVNVVDDSDPYAFPDNDAEPVQTSSNQSSESGRTGSNQSEPVESSQNQTVTSPHAHHHHHVTATVAEVTKSVAVTMATPPPPASSGIHTGLVNSLLHTNLGEVTETSSMLPPTPPTGGTPIAKLYPELAGKLHSSPVAEKPVSSSSSSVLSSVSGKGGKNGSLASARLHCSSGVGDKPQSNMNSRGKNSNTGLMSSKAKSPSSHSHSSRTMNKLQTKIAQNRIKDKQKSKLKRESEEGGTLGLVAIDDVSLPVIPLGGGASSSDTTSTIFSRGSIPSLGNLLSQDRGQRRLATAISASFPVAATAAVDRVTNGNGSHVISSPTVATVIPATVFMPFPNLACALSSLSNNKVKQATASQSQGQAKGKVKHGGQAANSNNKIKSGNCISGTKKKSERTKRTRGTANSKKAKACSINNSKLVKKPQARTLIENSDLLKGGAMKEDLHLGVVVKGLAGKAESLKVAGKGLNNLQADLMGSSGHDELKGEKSSCVSTGNSSQIKENSCQRLALSHNNHRPRNLDLPKLYTVTGLLNQADYTPTKTERRISTVNNEDSKTTRPEILYTSQNALHHLVKTQSDKAQVSPDKESGQDEICGKQQDWVDSVGVKIEDIKSEPPDGFGDGNSSFPAAVRELGHNTTSPEGEEVKVKKSQKLVKRLLLVGKDKKNVSKVRQGSASVIHRRPCRFWKKANVLTEFEAKKVFRRKSSVAAYRHHASNLKANTPLLKFGVTSSSDDDTPQPLYSSWDQVCLDEEEEHTCDNHLSDSQLLSTIRSTKISLVKSRFRRQLSHSRKLSHVSPYVYPGNSQATLELIQAARKDAKAASLVVRAMNGEVDKVRKMSESEDIIYPVRTCLVTSTETGKSCSKRALPFTNHCPQHIMYNVDQQLFGYCTAKFANNTQCCRPVVDLRHELPLCTEHALKADNYQKSLKAPKKPRKKTKPSALTRPPKKGKKRKNQQQQRRLSTAGGGNSGNGIFADLESLVSVKDEETDDMEVKPELSSVSEISVAPEISVDVKVKVEEDDYTELEETFSPDTLDKTLELPLDMLEATKFLDKHDLGDMFNKLPDYAFDLFPATETAKPSDLTPTKEETELLEAAIAEASSSEFSFPSNPHHQPQSDLQHLGPGPTKTTRVSAGSSSGGGLDGLCLPVSITKETLDKLAIEKISQEPPLDYMSDDDEDKEDELTKQIASSLMQQHLSEEEDVMDQDNINNLASSLTASDLNCISKALSGSDLEMNLTTLNEGQSGVLGDIQQQQATAAVVAAAAAAGMGALDQGHPPPIPPPPPSSQHVVQQYPPLPPPPPPQGLPTGLHGNTNNNQGHSGSIPAAAVTPTTDQRAKDEGEIGGQLAQILETFRNDHGTMDRLQQNIRQFLNNESPTPSVMIPISSNSHSNPLPQHHPQLRQQQPQQQQQQQLPMASAPSILQEFLTMGKQHAVSRVESPGYIAQAETFPALLRQSSNDSSYSSGSGTANSGHRFKHEPGQVTLMGSTNTPNVSSMNDAPPNVSVTEIPPNVSVTDIPVTCQAKGPPNVTVTAIPASFQVSSAPWPPSINNNSSGITIPSFSSIQAQLNMITSQLAAASNATVNLSPQKTTNPPKRSQAKQKSPRTKKAKKTHAPQLTLDIAAANIASQQAASMTPIITEQASIRPSDQTSMGTVASSHPQIKVTTAQYLAPPQIMENTATTPVNLVGKSLSGKVQSPVQIYQPRTPQQHITPSPRLLFQQPPPVHKSETQQIVIPKAQSTQASAVVNNPSPGKWDPGKVLIQASATAANASVSPMPMPAIQMNTINIPAQSQVCQQVKSNPLVIKGSPAKNQTMPLFPSQTGVPSHSVVVGSGPMIRHQQVILQPSANNVSAPPATVMSSPVSLGTKPQQTLQFVSSPLGKIEHSLNHQVSWQTSSQATTIATTATTTAASANTNEKGNFTVSTSTQAFLASLLQDTSAKKQQVTPEQQKMLQQLQQSAISAIPAVPSQSFHSSFQQQQKTVSSLPGQMTVGSVSNLVSSTPVAAKMSLQHLLQGPLIPVTSASGNQVSNLQNANMKASVLNKESKQSCEPMSTVALGKPDKEQKVMYSSTPQPMTSPATPNSTPQNISLPRYPTSQVTKSPVYFHGNMLPPLRSSPRQQPPLPRSSQGHMNPPMRPTSNPSPTLAKPTLMATSMQSVRIPMNSDLQKNICMLNPILSNIIQQASVNNNSNLAQKVSQGLPSPLTSMASIAAPNTTHLSGSSPSPSLGSSIISMTTLGSNPSLQGVQGAASSLPMVWTGKTQNPVAVTVNPVNPSNKTQSTVRLENSTTPLLLSTPILSHPSLGAAKPMAGNFSAKTTTSIFQLPINNLIRSPVKSQMMPHLPAPIVSTTMSGEQVLRHSSELLSSINSSFGHVAGVAASQNVPVVTGSHKLTHQNAVNRTSIMQSVLNTTNPIQVGSVISTEIISPLSTGSVTCVASNIYTNTPIVSPVLGSSVVVRTPMTDISTTSTHSVTKNNSLIGNVTGNMSSSPVAVLPNVSPNAQTPSNMSLPTLASFSELPPGFLENFGAISPNSLPQIAAALQHAQATLATTGSGGGGEGVGRKLSSYPLALPPSVRGALPNQTLVTQAPAANQQQLILQQQQHPRQLPRQPVTRQPFLIAQLPTTSGSQDIQQDTGIDKV